MDFLFRTAHCKPIREVRTWGGLLSIAMLLLGCSASTGASHASTSTSHNDANGRLYGLPTDGWQSGDAGLNALVSGTFHAELRNGLGCAWLGPKRAPFLWPESYRVRTNPVELVDANGVVVAQGGQHVQAGGGYVSVSKTTPCVSKGQIAWAVESSVTKVP